MPKRPVLIILGKVTAVVHILIFVAVITVAIFLVEVWLIASLLMVFVVLSQIVFQDDCALRIFEYCLRGLGGEEIDHDRLNSMSTPQARLVEPEELYHHLLWQSGLFLLVAAIATIGGTVATIIWL